jgi:hypothetical protein
MRGGEHGAADEGGDQVRYAIWGFIVLCVSHAAKNRVRDTADGLRAALERLGCGS